MEIKHARNRGILGDITDHVSNMQLFCASGLCGKRGEYPSLVARMPTCENVPVQISGDCFSNGGFYQGPPCVFCVR